MGAVKLRPVPPPAPHWWHSLAEILGFSRRHAMDFWRALSSSKDERLAALVYRCHAHEAYLKTQRLDLLTDGRMLNTFLASTWTPHQMILALETLFKEHRLSRQSCNAMQERFLCRSNKDGLWTQHR